MFRVATQAGVFWTMVKPVKVFRASRALYRWTHLAFKIAHRCQQV